jgi:hypothetical protein
MPDNNTVSNTDLWQKILSGIGIVVGGAAGGWSLARAKISKQRGGSPVGWEQAIQELKDQMAAARTIAIEAREDARRLRDRDLTMISQQIERIETQALLERDDTHAILDRISHDVLLLKRRFLPELSKPPERLPE